MGAQKKKKPVSYISSSADQLVFFTEHHTIFQFFFIHIKRVVERNTRYTITTTRKEKK